MAKGAVQLVTRMTGKTWFDTLPEGVHGTVNIWQPNGRNGFRAVKLSESFQFKLHAASPLVQAAFRTRIAR